MALIGLAKLYWLNVEQQLEYTRRPSIDRWDEIKYKFWEKYKPPHFRKCMLDQLSNLHQCSSTLSEYMMPFDELIIHCDVQEDCELTLSRFKNGLHSKIQHEIGSHTMKTIEYAFQWACEIEHYQITSSKCLDLCKSQKG